MAVTQVWTSPATGGSIHLQTGGTITQTWIEQVAGDLLVLGGTAGFGTVSAANGIQPASGFFMGGIGGNRHVEGGSVAIASTTVAITFGNQFAGTPNFTAIATAAGSYISLDSISTTGATIRSNNTATNTAYWLVEGAD